MIISRKKIPPHCVRRDFLIFGDIIKKKCTTIRFANNIILFFNNYIKINPNKINNKKLIIINNNPYNIQKIGVIVMEENISISRKIKILLAYRNMKMADLAERMHISRSSLSERMKRDRWSLPDLQEIADILDSDVCFSFVMRDTGQKI